MKEFNVKEISGMFEGKIAPVTIKLALPIFFSQILHTLYLFADTFFISIIDKNSTAIISGTGLVFPIFFIFMSLGIGISTGTGTLISRGIGEKNKDALINAIESGFLITVLLTLILSIPTALFGKQAIILLSGNGMSTEAIQNGFYYLIYLIPGMTLILFNNVLFGTLQGEGLNKYIAISMAISMIANIILDPIFIFTLNLGVKGAAIATSLSILISTTYTVFVFIKNKSSILFSMNIFDAKWKLVKEITRIGFPQSLSMLSLSIAFMFLNNFVSSIGQDAMNAWTICGRSDQLVIMPAMAISTATLTMIGQNYGRDNLNRVSQIYTRNVSIAFISTGLIAILYNLIAPHLFSAFSSVEDVVELSITQVRVLSFTYMGIATAIISASTLQAVGKPIIALAINIIRMGLIAVPMAYFLVYYLHMGVIGVFIALGFGNILALVASFTITRSHLNKLAFEKVV